jgi:hypothetical protein
VSNPQKAKGSAFERLVRDYLAEQIPCERIPPGSSIDRGDLWTPSCVVQCKNHRALRISEWLTQTCQQQISANKPLHALAVKRARTTDPADQLVVMTLEQLRHLLTRYK